jgi:outer membrane receptor for ferric coprogen and ferric-rhodotorulic acid
MSKNKQIGSSLLCALSVLSIVLGAASVAVADTAGGGPQQGSPEGPADSNSTLEEVVVTAETYKSTAQSTPISISALSGSQLESSGINSLEQVARDVPGLSMRSSGPNQTEFEARGIASNGGNSPTVGFYLGDIPLSPPAMGQIGKF